MPKNDVIRPTQMCGQTNWFVVILIGVFCIVIVNVLAHQLRHKPIKTEPEYLKYMVRQMNNGLERYHKNQKAYPLILDILHHPEEHVKPYINEETFFVEGFSWEYESLDGDYIIKLVPNMVLMDDAAVYVSDQSGEVRMITTDPKTGQTYIDPPYPVELINPEDRGPSPAATFDP